MALSSHRPSKFLYVVKWIPVGKWPSFFPKGSELFCFWGPLSWWILNSANPEGGTEEARVAHSPSHRSLMSSVSFVVLLSADWAVISKLSHSNCHLHQLWKPDYLLSYFVSLFSYSSYSSQCISQVTWGIQNKSSIRCGLINTIPGLDYHLLCSVNAV